MDFALALLSGALLALSFPKFGHPAFGWIALAPLLVALAHRPQSVRRSFTLGLLAGCVYFAGTLYWFVVTLTLYGGLSTPIATFAAAMGLAYLALYPAVFAVIQARLVKAFGRSALLLAPAAWVATEMARTRRSTGPGAGGWSVPSWRPSSSGPASGGRCGSAATR